MDELSKEFNRVESGLLENIEEFNRLYPEMGSFSDPSTFNAITWHTFANMLNIKGTNSNSTKLIKTISAKIM